LLFSPVCPADADLSIFGQIGADSFELFLVDPLDAFDLVGVVDEPGERLIAEGDVTGEHPHARRSVLAIPARGDARSARCTPSSVVRSRG
jgi:hypothetical protein